MEKIYQTEIEPENEYIYFCKSIEGKLAIFRARKGRKPKVKSNN